MAASKLKTTMSVLDHRLLFKYQNTQVGCKVKC